ncbi:MAG: amidohydrolase family protein [SAR202 cluster bacterium]|jgi:N-acyl-D-amino-acid deacylase|nr:amidohydrolase family protein [SAR202 cluster bacterium]
MLDVLITGGMVVDGRETPSYIADVGIAGHRIEAIGNLSQHKARRVIDASGLTVAPGFIDTHVHSEGDLLINPQHACGLRQGITTELLGIDGMSYAPLSNENYRIYRRWLKGLLGEPPEDLDMSSVKAFRANYHEKVSINTAYLVPNGTMRLEVAGFHDVPLEGDTMKAAKDLVRESMHQGAIGFSTGSSYYPGPWTSTDELVELCEVVRDSNGVYMAEPRRANPERAFKGGGVPEVLEIARRSGVKIHLAHFRTDPKTAGKVREHMALIDEAKSNGVDVTLDIYPYASGSTIPISFLPSEAQEGGPEAIVKRLKDPKERKKIVDYLENEYYYLRSLEEVVFSYVPKNTHLEGISLPEYAASKNASLGEALCDLLIEEDLGIGYTMPPPTSYGLWQQVSRDSMKLLARDDYMVCSDITPAGNMPHPRSYGAFPRFLGRLRRKFGGITLEEMVHRMTGRPAERFNLTDRGRIEKGYFADITIFDADRVIDTSTYDDPIQYPVGIPFVLVNGKVAVDHERCTGVMAGQAIP